MVGLNKKQRSDLHSRRRKPGAAKSAKEHKNYILFMIQCQQTIFMKCQTRIKF
jgi:hypothetical protein